MVTSKKYSKKKLNIFKKNVLNKREDVLKDILESKDIADNMLENSGSTNAIYSSHMADAGSDHQEIEKAYYWVHRENKFLKYLDRALEMIDEGTFGVCIKCGKLINSERLLEVPHTSSCFDCKNHN